MGTRQPGDALSPSPAAARDDRPVDGGGPGTEGCALLSGSGGGSKRKHCARDVSVFCNAGGNRRRRTVANCRCSLHALLQSLTPVLR